MPDTYYSTSPGGTRGLKYNRNTKDTSNLPDTVYGKRGAEAPAGYYLAGQVEDTYTDRSYRYVPMFKRLPDFQKQAGAAIEAARQQQAAAAAALQKQYETTQADIAKQLKIVQEEKSAVSKLSQEYSDMLIKEAEAKRKAQEEARIALRTDRANLARAGQRGSLQIQPAGSTPRTTAGTQQFRRRAMQFGGGTTGTPYTGLSKISSGMVNV